MLETEETQRKRHFISSKTTKGFYLFAYLFIFCGKHKNYWGEGKKKKRERSNQTKYMSSPLKHSMESKQDLVRQNANQNSIF